MSALTLVVTDAGRAALVNATNTGTDPVLLAAVGVTDQAFTAAADTAALPGELKRLTTFAGAAVAADTLHVSIRDDSAASYSLRGFALYLDDGTLFASYGQAEPIGEKSAQSMFLLALDVIFADIDAASLTFGDTNFVLASATTEQQGIVELATDAEASAGTDATRAVVPKGLKAALDARFGAGAPSAFVKGLLTKATAALLRAALEIKSAAGFDTGTGNGLDADLLDGQHGSYYRAWGNFTGVPTVFPPAAHQHAWGDISNPPATATRWPAWSEVTAKPTTFPPAAHSQDWSTILSIPATATRWPAWSEVTNKPSVALTGGSTFTGIVGFEYNGADSYANLAYFGTQDNNKRLFLAINNGTYAWLSNGWYGVPSVYMTWNIAGSPRLMSLDKNGLLTPRQVQWASTDGLAVPGNDLNQITLPALDYAANGAGNKPAESAAFGAVIAANMVNNTRAQVYLECTPSAPNRLWLRHTNDYNGGTGATWTAWSRMVTLDELAPYRLKSDGAFSVAVTAPGFTTSSDPRLKDDLKPLTLDRAAVDGVGAWMWMWNEHTQRAGEAGAGVRSDEVRTAFPGVVESDGDGFDVVDYGKLGTHLGVAANQRVRELEERVRVLEIRLGTALTALSLR